MMFRATRFQRRWWIQGQKWRTKVGVVGMVANLTSLRCWIFCWLRWRSRWWLAVWRERIFLRWILAGPQRCAMSRMLPLIGSMAFSVCPLSSSLRFPRESPVPGELTFHNSLFFQFRPFFFLTNLFQSVIEVSILLTLFSVQIRVFWFTFSLGLDLLFGFYFMLFNVIVVSILLLQVSDWMSLYM